MLALFAALHTNDLLDLKARQELPGSVWGVASKVALDPFWRAVWVCSNAQLRGLEAFHEPQTLQLSQLFEESGSGSHDDQRIITYYWVGPWDM